MECPKFRFEINDSMRTSYCRNCEWDCTGTKIPWITSVKITVGERHEIARTPPQKPSNLPICIFCNEKSLFVYPNGIQVTCLNYRCTLYKATGVLVKDGDKVYIRRI